MKRFTFVLAVLVLLVCVATYVAQPLSEKDSTYLNSFKGISFNEMVPMIWLDVCQMNRAQYPDSNLVMPGQTILLPCDMLYVAKDNGGNDHMWQASLYFANTLAKPYLEGKLVIRDFTPVPVIPQVKEDNSEVPLWVWVLIILFLLAVGSIFQRLNQKKTAKKVDTPFVSDPPDLHTSDSTLLSTAENSLRSVLGQGFEIIGVPERGVLNGEQIMFFADGSKKTERFSNEPGFRARVRFDDKTESLIVCRWSCFNPCWGARNAQFKGTFTPTNETEQEIPTLTNQQEGSISNNIERLRQGETSTYMPAYIPNIQVKEEKSNNSATETKTKPDNKLHLTKLQYSNEKGLNLEGEFPMTMKELKDLLVQVQGKPNTADKK